jgi:hypothetical protein
VFDPVMAERRMRTVWPMLWLLPDPGRHCGDRRTRRGAHRASAGADRLAGVLSIPPGRIDHHNVQIALSLLALAATVWSDRARIAAYAAGAVTGLVLAIGLECLPYLIACGVLFTAHYVLDRAGGGRLRARARRKFGRGVFHCCRAGALDARPV